MIRSPVLTVSSENVATIAELFHGFGIFGCDVIYDHIAKEINNVTANPAPMPAARINTLPQEILVMIITFIIIAVSVPYSVIDSNLFKHNIKITRSGPTWPRSSSSTCSAVSCLLVERVQENAFLNDIGS